MKIEYGYLVRFNFLNGSALVHNPDRCEGRSCALHNPSEHNMKDMPMILRESTLIERQCEHGVGHPDPDSVLYLNTVNNLRMWDIHGCCSEGCCQKDI